MYLTMLKVRPTKCLHTHEPIVSSNQTQVNYANVSEKSSVIHGFDQVKGQTHKPNKGFKLKGMLYCLKYSNKCKNEQKRG